MSGDDVVQLFAAAGGATIVTTFVNALFNKRKLGAEATEIITKGATGIVERVEQDNARLRAEMAANEARHQREIAEVESRHQREIGEVRNELRHMKTTQSLADERERMHLVAEERNRAHLERWHRYCARQTVVIRSLNGEIEDPPPMFPEPLVSTGSTEREPDQATVD